MRIRYSQAFRLVPARNERKAVYALTYVSCTRSSASAGFRVIRKAAPYNWSSSGERVALEPGNQLIRSFGRFGHCAVDRFSYL